MIPALLAPLLSQGLSLIGNAVMAKGKDWVEEKTGVKLNGPLSDADAMKLIDEFDGFLEFRYSGADHQTVDRGACRAGLLDQSFTADLKLPQVRIQEKSVELNCPAGLEQRAHLRHPPLEDRLGDLTAAGELGPVPGVGRGGDDFRVDRGRRHAGQQDR